MKIHIEVDGEHDFTKMEDLRSLATNLVGYLHEQGLHGLRVDI